MGKTDLTKDIIHEVRTLSSCLIKDFDERLTSFGLTGSQGRILFFIVKKEKENVKVHQNDIELAFHACKSSISEIVSRMIKSGYLIREKEKSYCNIHSTQKGKDIIDEIKKQKQATIEKLFEGFSEADRKLTSEHITKMIENLRKEN